EPAAPGQPVAPGQPARRGFEYVRHGTADLLAAVCVQTGQGSGIVRQRHRARGVIELLRLLHGRVPRDQPIHLFLKPRPVHGSAEVAGYVSYHPDRFQFHWLPKHASWLSFIEVWFAILSKKCLKRSELVDFAAAEQTVAEFIATYNTHQAHPFTWRKGVRF